MARSDFLKALTVVFLFLPAALPLVAGDAKSSRYASSAQNSKVIPANVKIENSNDLVFEHLTVEQGLPSNSVYAILQDHRGFMWFGTNNGLTKYDGYSYTVYRGDMPDTNFRRFSNVGQFYEDKWGTLWLLGLSKLVGFEKATGKVTNYYTIEPVYDLYEDAAGTLWFATVGKGLNKFERTSGTFTRYNLSNDTLFCIGAESNGPGGILWIGGASGVDRFDPADGTFTHVAGSSGYHVTAIYKDRAGTLWIGTNEGLYTFDEVTRTLWRGPIDIWRSSGFFSNFVHSFSEDRNGILWIGAGDDLFSFDRASGKFVQYPRDPFAVPFSRKSIKPIYEDRMGSLWLKTRKGLSRFDPVSNTIVSYVHDRKDPSSLSDDAVNEVYEDRSGALWIATVWGGVNRLDRARKTFIHHAHSPAYSWSLTHNTVHGMCEDRSGQVWVATRGGLERFDRKTGKFTHFRHDPLNPHSLSSNIVRAVLEDHEGTIWIGTEARGLDRLDFADDRADGKAKVRFRHYTHDPGNPLSIGSNNILSLFEDGSGKIWIGTADAGLDQFSKDSGIFVHYRSDPGDSNSLSSNWVNAICEDSKNRLWVGTGFSSRGALHRLDRSTRKFARFKEDQQPKGSIHSIYEDRGGTLWIGTTHDLNRFDPSTGTFTHCNVSQHTGGNYITGILEDRTGCLWLTLSKGVSTYNPRTGKFRSYDKSDGVPINPTWGKACCKSRNGEMFFGGSNGFVRFHPDSIRDNPYIPPVVITAFKIFDKPVSLDTVISEKQVLQLSYHDNAISFEFVALNYTSPEKNQYAYKLEGFDEDWVYCGTRRYASYTNLDKGSYVFRVRGSNNDGVWNEEGTSIDLIIAPPWWRTTWAYFGYGAAIVMVLYGLRGYDRRQTLLKHQLEMKDFETEKLREMDAMKMRFFANISHEFRTPLTMILGPVDTLLARRNRSPDKEQLGIIRRNALRLLELIGQLLDISKLDAGKMKMQVQVLDLVPFLRRLVCSFASLAERKRIHLGFNAEVKSVLAFADRDKLETIVTNLLSNAFKFTQEEGEISVGLSAMGEAVEGNQSQKHQNRREGFVEIAVSDTGIGIPMQKLEKIFQRFYQVDDSHVREHEGAGIGLALTRELVEIHHGHISVTSKPGQGSTFRVRLPLGKEQWKEEEILEETEDAEGPPVRAPASLQEPIKAKELKGGGQEERLGEDRPLVLIVEDNADVRSYVRSYLEQQFRVEEAVDGITGLEFAIHHIPDLVVSDIMMPEMDGVELCRKLKTDERTSHIPVVLLTSRASDEGKLEGLETGADDYIIKPFAANELEVRIRNLITLRKRLREKFRRQCILEPPDYPIESVDEKFLRKAVEVVRHHMSESGFTAASLAREMCMSRMQLYRKLHALTGRTPHEFIRGLRLERAAHLLEAHWGNVAEVSLEVGFNSLSHFAKVFRDTYGVLPSQYEKQHALGSHH